MPRFNSSSLRDTAAFECSISATSSGTSSTAITCPFFTRSPISTLIRFTYPETFAYRLISWYGRKTPARSKSAFMSPRTTGTTATATASALAACSVFPQPQITAAPASTTPAKSVALARPILREPSFMFTPLEVRSVIARIRVHTNCRLAAFGDRFNGGLPERDRSSRDSFQ